MKEMDFKMKRGNKKKDIIEEFNARRYGAFRHNDYLKFEIVAGLLSRDKRAKLICDLGCGDGALGEILINGGHKVVGVDISESALKHAQSRGLLTQKINFEDYYLPFEDRYFDAITACEIIEHIYDTDRFLKEIFRILKPEGTLVITTPNAVSLGRRIFYLFGNGIFFETSLNGDSAGHIRYFVKDSLTALLQRNSFLLLSFQSDFVNFTQSGIFRSRWLAKVFPTFGGSLIFASKKKEERICSLEMHY